MFMRPSLHPSKSQSIKILNHKTQRKENLIRLRDWKSLGEYKWEEEVRMIKGLRTRKISALPKEYNIQ